MGADHPPRDLLRLNRGAHRAGGPVGAGVCPERTPQRCTAPLSRRAFWRWQRGWDAPPRMLRASTQSKHIPLQLYPTEKPGTHVRVTFDAS